MKLKMNFKLIAVLALGFSLLVFQPELAQADAFSSENDAIAVRVLPNPNHYSAARWYQSQGFSGSPQSLLVDSYDAVRDGRSVYVNAANVDLANKTIYTNIYLISYNQDPNVTTVDVLGQIVDHWQFNSNLSSAGSCNISTLNCNGDTDCSQGMTCVSVADSSGRCQLVENDACYTDNDCSQGLYCDNLRSKVARDVRRLGMLGNLRESLSVFMQVNGRYPVLGSGTYLPLNSISVWPSWQSSFLPQLGVSQSALDPINSLGVCDGFDAVTCWDKKTQAFADPEPSNNTLELPAQSYVFSYDSDSNGSDYNLCAAMETKAMNYNTAEGQLSEMGCIASGAGYTGSGNNLPPVLIDTNLYGEQNQSFNGFIKVIDPENNPLSWSINTASTNWSGWSAAPVLQDTYNPNQKKLYASKAGAIGTYNVILSVTDAEGATMSTNTPIIITNDAPLIQSEDVDYYPSTVIPLTINFSIADRDYPLSYTIAKPLYNSGPYDLLASSKSTFLGETSHRSGDTTYYTLKYNLLTSNKFVQDTTFAYLITATDNYNVVSTRQVRINIKVDLPILDFNCAKSIRLGSSYYCGLGWRSQGDHTISYTAVGALPAGLQVSDSVNASNPDDETLLNLGPWQKILAWLGFNKENIFHKAEAAILASYYSIQGTPTIASSSNLIIIKAENEFGAVSQREFNLAVNNYCGDGSKQQPNLEGRGGFYNDGQEDCDGNSGIVLSSSQISISTSTFQYACTTVVGEETPYPIMNNQFFCTFSDDEINGGFCGDGVCQLSIERNGNMIPWENGANCWQDCANCGQNSSYNGSECVCNSGWFDCYNTPGCDSQTVCDEEITDPGGSDCPVGEHLCGGNCYEDLLPHQVTCATQINKCSAGSGNCNIFCDEGDYNCDHTNECESIGSCDCTNGTVWNNLAWPNGNCIVDNPGGCDAGEGLCGDQCYNLQNEKCCDEGSSSVCPENKICCDVDGVNICTNNLTECQQEQGNYCIQSSHNDYVYCIYR